VEAQRHLSILHADVASISLELVDDGSDGFKLLLGVGPQDERFLQQKQTPLHDFFIVLVAAVVEGHFDEEVETDLGRTVVEVVLENGGFLIEGSI